MTHITELRLGRNFIRVGDVVRVTPSKPRKRDGCLARVVDLVSVGRGLGSGSDIEVHVITPRGFRVLRRDRIERVQQTRGGEKRQAR